MDIIIILAILAFLYFYLTDNKRMDREVNEDYEQRAQNETKTYKGYRPKATYKPTHKRKSTTKSNDIYIKNINYDLLFLYFVRYDLYQNYKEFQNVLYLV